VKGGTTVLHRLLITVTALAAVTATAAAQVGPYPYPKYPPPGPPLPYPSPYRQQAFWVQFRQPYWRVQQFRSPGELAAFVADCQRNGWEVQVLSSGRGRQTARARLMQWGGSRIVYDLGEAQRWAAYLAELGYEPRIVDYPG
jgi:hypothetical protein